MSGAGGHKDTWTEHLKLGETDLISCNLGLNITDFYKAEWDSDSNTFVQVPTCPTHFSFTLERVASCRARYYCANFPDQIKFRSEKACSEIGKQPYLHSVMEVGRRGEPQLLTPPLKEPSTMNTFSSCPAQQDCTQQQWAWVVLAEAAKHSQTLAMQPCCLVEVERELTATKL